MKLALTHEAPTSGVAGGLRVNACGFKQEPDRASPGPRAAADTNNDRKVIALALLFPIIMVIITAVITNMIGILVTTTVFNYHHH